MKIRDLGALSGDICLFGGIYSNVQAFDALLTWADAHDFPTSNLICTGDQVAYCADPKAVVARMVSEGIASVAGNCEVQLANGEQDCGCGFEENSVCDLASKGWFPYAIVRTLEFRDYFEGLPDILTFTAHGKRFALIHGGVTDVARYLWPTSAHTEFVEEIDTITASVGEVDGVICGHSGIAFHRKINGMDWINAGVIGMPPHDGRTQTRFAVLSKDGVRFHSLSFDHAAAAQAMRDTGLQHGYETALETGIWPSEDILPDALRR